MKIKMAALVAALMTFLAVASAQEHPTVTAQANTVYVGADGKYETAPDTALVQFTISTQADKAKTAYDQASRGAEQVRQLLRANGISPQTAEFGFFSLQPVYEYRSPKRKLVAYRVNSSISVRVKDFSKVSPIVEQLADIDVTEYQSINYILENMDAAKIKAVDDAYAHARAEADVLARAAQRSVGELSYASVDTFEQVRVMPMAGRAMAGTMERSAMTAPTEEFTPQKVTVTAHVNALFTLK